MAAATSSPPPPRPCGESLWNARGKRRRKKRGGGFKRVDLDCVDLAMDSNSDVLLALDEALQRYAVKDPQGAELIKLRFFIGVPNHQAAAILGIPERTAKRTWAFARAWLMREMQKSL